MYPLCRILLISFLFASGCCLCLAVAVFGGVVLFVLVLAGLALAVRLKKTKLTAYGTARWATEEELQRAGMLAGHGLLIGTPLEPERPSLQAATLALFNLRVASEVACKRFLRSIFPNIDNIPPRVRLSRACHLSVVAPSNVGKGVSCVIPFLLECPDSCVVVDFKGENALITAERRRRMGHRIVLLDPYQMVTRNPGSFNPIDFIRKDSPHVIDEIRDLAESLVIRTGQEREPHWNDSAETWIAAAIAAVVEYGDPDDRSLQTVRDLLSAGPEKLDIMAKLLCESESCDGMLSRLGYQLTQFKDKELASTLTTTNRFLRHLDTLAVAASTRTSTFDPAELLTGKMTVYLILPPEHARTQSPLLRMWISALLRAVVRGGLDQHRPSALPPRRGGLTRPSRLFGRCRGQISRLRRPPDFHLPEPGTAQEVFPGGPGANAAIKRQPSVLRRQRFGDRRVHLKSPRRRDHRRRQRQRQPRDHAAAQLPRPRQLQHFVE